MADETLKTDLPSVDYEDDIVGLVTQLTHSFSNSAVINADIEMPQPLLHFDLLLYVVDGKLARSRKI